MKIDTEKSKLLANNGWDMNIFAGKLFFKTDTRERKKYYGYDGQQLTQISETEFWEVKYGKHFEKIFSVFGEVPNSSIVLTDGTVIATEYKDFYIHIFNPQGELIRKIEDVGFDSIYDIAFEPPDGLWCAIPTANAIRKY